MQTHPAKTASPLPDRYRGLEQRYHISFNVARAAVKGHLGRVPAVSIRRVLRRLFACRLVSTTNGVIIAVFPGVLLESGCGWKCAGPRPVGTRVLCPLEYSIERLTCAVASRLDAVMVG